MFPKCKYFPINNYSELFLSSTSATSQNPVFWQIATGTIGGFPVCLAA
jgi:hypothetical protein